MFPDFDNSLYLKYRNSLNWFDFSGAEPTAYTLALPVAMAAMHVMSPDQWIIRDDTDKYVSESTMFLRTYTTSTYSGTPLKGNP